MLERGGTRSTQNDFGVPLIRDELRFSQRHDLMMDVAKDTYTIRNKPSETALPMRRLGSFLPGEGVGGAGVHWNGVTWRWPDHELRIRTKYEERYGKNFIPADMPLQDWGITGAEIEPYYDKFEYTAGVSGKAGNIKGQIQPGGNPFEDPRARDYPNPPLVAESREQALQQGRDRARLSPLPAADRECLAALHQSRRHEARAVPILRLLRTVRLRGQRQGQPAHHGHSGCAAQSKRGAAHPLLGHQGAQGFDRQEGDRRRLCQHVDRRGDRAAGRARRPRGLRTCPTSTSCCCRASANPTMPKPQTGVIGKNYAYQGGSNVALFFEGTNFNPFIATGGWGTSIDDFHTNWDFDRGKHGYIGGSYISVAGSHGRPISYRPVPPGTPQWGSAWKRATAKWYQGSLAISASGMVLPNRYNALDLDPTYKNRFGQPLMRMTFDFKENEQKMYRHSAEVIGQIGRAMNPTVMGNPTPRLTWSVVPYQSTHNTGGAIMGADPGNSALNKYLQSWDVPNVFVMGASAFPHNSGYNPTGPVGALAYWAADAIREKYLKNPRPLV